MRISARISTSLIVLSAAAWGQQSFWGLNTAATVAPSSWDVGFDFRATRTNAADPSYAGYISSVGGNPPTQACPATDNNYVVYPTTCVIDGVVVTYGWETPNANMPYLDSRDFPAGNDPRIAGEATITNGRGQVVFRVDLPATGIYKVQALFGDLRVYTSATYAEIDDNYAAVWNGPGLSPPCANDGYHVSDINCSNIAVSTNLGVVPSTGNLTFSTTIVRFKLGNSAGSQSSTINHLRIIKQ